MQRRTNLFYTNGNDSNFITFSNYTESLTGNFLTLNWKLFPSKFICLYIPELDGNITNKSEFIKNVTAYYENKLAFVRDQNIKNNKSIDESVYPLSWLLECLSKICINGFDITYIGNITEQNYNGVYADTICTIDGTAKSHTYSLKLPSVDDKLLKPFKHNPLKYDFSTEYLYGWYNNEDYTGILEYKSVSPIFDNHDEEEYNYYDANILYKEIFNEGTSDGDIKFNVIIPLFNLINVDTNENSNNINEDINDLTLGVNETTHNMPIGIWFANKSIILNRDTSTGYAPSWSLVLSSQFKPIPYSDKLLNDGESFTSAAHETFAHVLSRQNKMFDLFENLHIELNELKNHISAIESKISNMGTISNIDGIHKEFILLKQSLNNKIDTLTDRVNELEQN